jgi:tetratricopeptide (TPR) repeat protein
MRSVLIVLAMMALAACDARAMQAGESPADANVEAPLATARMLYQQGNYSDAQAALATAVQPTMLNGFTPQRRREVIELYADAAWWGGDDGQALWAWKIATRDPAASTADWQGRMMAAAALLDAADAYASFDHLRRTAPEAVRSISPAMLDVLAMDFDLLPNAGEATVQLAQVLQPVRRIDPNAELSAMWLHAAAVALDRGDKTEAAAFARNVDDPLVMVQLQADRRFDGLVAADPAGFDARGLAERQLAAAKAAATSNPGAQSSQLAVATALYNVGRLDDSLDALDDALSAAPASGEGAGLAASLAARKVTVLYEAGRADEALAIDSTMCAVCNVSFKYQEARLLLGLGRPAKALRLLPARDAEPLLGAVAKAEFAAERSCAQHQLGHEAAAAPDLDFLRAHLNYGPEAAIGALLCAGSDDEVARTLITMLADPAMRDPALGALQTYRADKLPAFALSLRERLARIAARPDVQAALAKVGRTATWDLPRYAILG